ncbi:MAG: prepilin-type N-terminal cleavage/methylation domain-containing protein [SAR324 cluster bacterium]|nr:prepilin-type N-terminal cleavage/methylation domain-containing protein [SAR324 cluster bacterium]
MFFKIKHSGFSLVEVMIVVVIIGILASLAYPSMEKYLLTSRQTEAKTNLMAVYTAQKIFHSTQRKYAADLKELGISFDQSDSAIYSYAMKTEDSEQAYLVTATGNLDSDDTIDTWTVDHMKNLINTVNDVLE